MQWIEQRLLYGSIEVGILAVLAALAVELFARRRARLRALIWLIVPIKALLVFLPTFWPVTEIPVAGAWSSEHEIRMDQSEGLVYAATGEPGRRELTEHHPVVSARHVDTTFLVFVWALGAGFVLVLQGCRFAAARSVVAQATGIPPGLSRMIRDEVDRFRLRRVPRLVVSTRAMGPTVACGLRPVIVIPHWLLTSGESETIRHIVGHELAHIKNRDHWSLIVQSMACALFWFHPAVWYAFRRWRGSMERACDDEAAGYGHVARDYAGSLMFMLEQMVRWRRVGIPSIGLYATRTEIGRRIERLVDRFGSTPQRTGRWHVLFWICGCVMATVFVLSPVGADGVEEQPGRSSLRIDFGPDDQQVEPGWVRWSGDRDRDFATGFDLDFEIEIDRGPAWRDQGDGNGLGNYSRVLRDGIRERDDDAIRAVIKRLDPGTYVLELFCCDAAADYRESGRFDVLIDGKAILRDQSTRGSASLMGAALPPVSIESHGAPIEVELRRLKGEIWLNGIVLSGTTRWAGDVSSGRIDTDEAPLSVQATIRNELSGAEVEKIVRRSRDDELVFVVEAEGNHGEIELEIAFDGTLQQRLEEWPIRHLPPVITREIDQLGPSVRVTRLRRSRISEAESYIVDIRDDDEREQIIFDVSGKILSRKRRK